MICPKCGHKFENPIARAGGLSKSTKKGRASRLNGKLGGRPRKAIITYPDKIPKGTKIILCVKEARAGVEPASLNK